MSRAGCDVAIAGDFVRVQKLLRILAFDVVLIDSASCSGDVDALVEQLRHVASPRVLRTVALGPPREGRFPCDAVVSRDATPAELLVAALGAAAADAHESHHLSEAR
jgi:hypothetical protein